MRLSPTERFSSRVEAYIKYRPSYPQEIIEYLKKETGFSSQHLVADIGSGTGFLSKLFLENGNTVYGVEPNNPMRKGAKKYLSGYKNFISHSGRAENTLLGENSVDYITSGQAFHWFEPLPTKKEFLRIARGGAKLVLVWNRRDLDNDLLQKIYEEIITELIPEYSKVDHKKIDNEQIKNFASPSILQIKTFDNFQLFDFDSFIGRLASSSYCPDESSELFKTIKNRLNDLFNKHSLNGKIKFNYKTMVYWSELK
jgi:SAM-dependent methyltransferase